MRGQIAPWEAFEEPFDFGTWRAAGRCLNLYQQRSFVGSVQTVGVETAAQVIGGGDKKLPDHFRLPRGQRFGIDGVDVRVREQAKALEALEGGNGRGKSGNRRRIKN